MMQGSATHKQPAAIQRGASWPCRSSAHHTSAAPRSAIPAPAPIPASAAAATASATAPISAPPPPHSRLHSQAMITAAATVRAHRNGPPSQIATSGSGASTSAERIRSLSDPLARANRGPVTPIATAEIGDGLLQIGPAEIGPQRLGEHQLGIGALPQQEIADALL